ncbi:MAG: hypothetical protein K2M98_04815 [Muribaculum sp.]|nr:hypothetical protein [Muribaculum sp.]
MNKYEYLRVDECLDSEDPVDATSSWSISDSRKETIAITTAVLPDGYWVYGYIVNWANGRTSVKKPSGERGEFRTQREAKLHAIGLMLMYLGYFLPETRDAISRAEAALMQSQLFD